MRSCTCESSAMRQGMKTETRPASRAAHVDPEAQRTKAKVVTPSSSPERTVATWCRATGLRVASRTGSTSRAGAIRCSEPARASRAG